MDTKYKRYEKLNSRLSEEDRLRLSSTYQLCSVCKEEKQLIEFYPVNEADRAGERCVECIVCRDIRNQEEGSRRAARIAKYGNLPIRQVKKREAYVDLLAKADAADSFRLNTFRELCAGCNISKPWVEFYPKDWQSVSQSRVEVCIVCEDAKSIKKKEIVQT